MSAVAAARQQTTPLFYEGTDFWKELVSQLQQQVSDINRAATAHGFLSDSLRLREGAQLSIVKDGSPSTEVRLALAFKPWGPSIQGVVSGQQESGRRFSSEEFDVPVARDLDGSVIAIFDEGRSFSASDLSRYLLRNFRRCFPTVALPC